MTDTSGKGDWGLEETERWLREVRRCGTMELHRLRLQRDPSYAERRRRAEAVASRFEAKRGRGASGRGAVIRIPVVVHVIYNTATENISDAQIHNQIDVMNTDYRLLNNVADLPAAFAPLAADTRIEFALAVRDPNCNPTDGITRTHTTHTSWPDFSDAMKTASTGGHDPWPTDRYLNIWVIANGGSFIGWGEFPGGDPNVDGVVIRNGVFGTGGTVPPGSAFDGGRTAVHEIGHYFNLIHIWGDEAACANDDNVADTPLQGDANSGCPVHPHITCGNSGDMFQNFMDYTNDSCYRLFTVGQVDRMRAALYTLRTGLLSSEGLVPPPAGGAAPDLWIMDTADDTGAEPNPTDDVMYASPDIWVRQHNDGLTDQTHQNAEYRPAGSGSNFVYVRVRNSGCGGTAGGQLKLYWAKASSALGWPAPWDGSVTSPALMGTLIGSQPVSVPGGDSVIVTFPWSPPNPADYASFGADKTHFCLLARIETSTTAPFGMTTPETGDLWANVKNNNNIAWKNISVVDDQPGGGRMESMLVTLPEKAEGDTRLVFTTRDPKGRTVFDWGRVLVRLGKELRAAWEKGGEQGEGVAPAWDDALVVRQPGAFVGGLRLEPGALSVLDVEFVPRRKLVAWSGLVSLDVEQYAGDRRVGGVRFEFAVTAPVPRGFVTREAVRWDGVGWPHDRLEGIDLASLLHSVDVRTLATRLGGHLPGG